jgi:hypothetical protein
MGRGYVMRSGGGGSQLSYSYSQSSYSTATTLQPRTHFKIGEHDPPTEPRVVQQERWDLFSMAGMDGTELGLAPKRAVEGHDDEGEGELAEDHDDHDFEDPFPALTYEAAEAEGLREVTIN